MLLQPVLLALTATVPLRQTPAPQWMWIALDIVAAAAGVGVGYLNGRHREFTLDPDSGEVMSRATPTGTVLFGAIFAIRFGLKYAFPQPGSGAAFTPASAL